MLIATTKVVDRKKIAKAETIRRPKNAMYFAAYISESIFSENELHTLITDLKFQPEYPHLTTLSFS